MTSRSAMISMGLVPEWHAKRRPEALALIHGEDALSWAQLARKTADKAARLVAIGVGEGDLVALHLPNGNAFVAWTFAIWRAGATPMPLPTGTVEREMDRLLQLGRPRAIVSVRHGEAVVEPLAGDAAGDRPLTAVSTPDGPSWKAVASGGSTGQPKLIVSDRAAVTDPATYELFPWDRHLGRLGRPEGVMINAGPLYHNGPFVHAFMNLFAGSTLVGMERFDAETWLRLVERHRVEFGYLVPTMMKRIHELPPESRDGYDLSSLRGIIHTAAPCPPWLKDAWIDWLGPDRVWEAYGSTEAVAATLIDGNEWKDRRGSVGRFYFGAAGRIDDKSGEPVPAGEVGELWVRAAAGRPPGFRYVGGEARERDGWYGFGDYARMDEDGYVWIVERRADIIIRGGTNIYPAEVEAVLEEYPPVRAAAVIGLPDADLGARVHAIVQLAEGAMLDEAALSAFVAERLAPFKRPSTYEVVDRPLRNASGKLRRSRLLEERVGKDATPTAGHKILAKPLPQD